LTRKSFISVAVVTLGLFVVGWLLPAWFETSSGGVANSRAGASTSPPGGEGASRSAGLPATGLSPADLEKKVARILASPEEWRADANRLAEVREYFGGLARVQGCPAAIRSAIQEVAASALPKAAKVVAVEVAALAAFEVGSPSDAELADLYRDAGPAFLPTMIRASPFAHQDRQVVHLHDWLKEELAKSGHKPDLPTRRLLVAAAMMAADRFDLNDLDALLSRLPPEIKEQAVFYLAAEAKALDPTLALQFVIQQWGKTPDKLARCVRQLQLAPAELKALCQLLGAEGAAGFVTAYAGQLKGLSSRYSLELAEAISAQDLPPATRLDVLDGLLQAKGSEANRWLTSLSPRERTAALTQIFTKMYTNRERGWTADAWLDAAAGCEGLDPHQVTQAILWAAGRSPLEKSLAYLQMLPAAERGEAEKLIYPRYIESKVMGADPNAIMALIDQVPAPFRQSALAAATTNSARFGPEQAWQWYQTTSDPAIKAALEEAILASPDASPVPAETRGRWLEERLKTGKSTPLLEQAVRFHLMNLAYSDHAEALAFVDQLPNAKMHDDAVRQLAQQWSAGNPGAASEWIVQIPPGHTRDLALNELIQASRNLPETGLLNASGIGDPKLRLEAATSVINWWKGRDPERARATLEQSPLSDGDKETLKRLIPN